MDKEIILVTGGAGFIGSHLCEALLKQNKKVVIVDNFNDFYDPTIKYRNIEEIKKTMKKNQIDENNLILFKEDIRNLDGIDKIFKQYTPVTVVHLAAMAGVRPSIQDPLLYEEVNVKGTLNILEMCKKHKIKSFIFASSSSVYGNNKKVPFSEDDPVDNPISPYAATKKAGELFCYTYHSLYDINVACLRFFTAYGPRQRPDLAIHKFTKLIMEDKEIPFYGDGSSQRDYTYIDDIIDGVVKAIDWVQKEGKRYEIFNLGESNTISLLEMVKTLEEVIGKKAKIKYLPMQQGDVEKTYAKILKAKTYLLYCPNKRFKEGIKSFILWYDQI